MTSQHGVGPYNEIMPRFGEITRDILFDEVWERPGLSKRDRSLITIAALAALYRTNQLEMNTRRALEHGVTKDEIGEVFTHMAFYGGWPTAANASIVATEVFGQG